MRGYIFFALLCAALAGPQTSDFFNPAPKDAPVLPMRMKYLSKYTNDELWRIQTQIIRQNQTVTSVRYGGAIFTVTKLTSDNTGPYYASCGDYQSNPSNNAFVNLATHLINTGIIGDARVAGDNLALLSAAEPMEPEGKRVTTAFSSPETGGTFAYLSSRGTWPKALSFSVPASYASSASSGSFDVQFPSSSASSAFKSLTVSFGSDANDAAFSANHFSFVFSFHDTQTRSGITPSSCTSVADPGVVPTSYNHTDVCLPRLGRRWIDPTSDERKGGSFTKTINFGTYLGTLSYLEIKVTQASLNALTFRAACQPISQPTNWLGFSGYFPTRWCVRYDPLAQVHVASVDRFLWAGAPAPF